MFLNWLNCGLGQMYLYLYFITSNLLPQKPKGLLSNERLEGGVDYNGPICARKRPNRIKPVPPVWQSDISSTYLEDANLMESYKN